VLKAEGHRVKREAKSRGLPLTIAGTEITTLLGSSYWGKEKLAEEM